MKIALVGSAPSSVQLAPYQDKSYNDWLQGKPAPQYPPSETIDDTWEIWGVSPGCFAQAPRATRWFEVHRWEPGKAWFSPEYCQFLRQFRGPVYTGGVIPEIPNHVVYPIEAVEAEFTAYFLHSSLSLMMAVAILEIQEKRAARLKASVDAGHTQPDSAVFLEADTIGLWGVDMAANEEYGDQRSGCHFFILEALRRGIGIYVPQESCLLRPKPIYGLSEWDHSYIKATARMREINARRQQFAAQMTEAANNKLALDGCVDNMQYFINTWMSPYGLPSGIVLTHEPGTGLGGGVTMPTAERGPVQGFIRASQPTINSNAEEVTEAVREDPAASRQNTGLNRPESGPKKTIKNRNLSRNNKPKPKRK